MRRGGITNLYVGQTASPKFFKPISILITSLVLAVSGAACGGSEKEDGPEQASDAGIVVADSGMTEHDAGRTEVDSGIIDNTDAGVIDESIKFISIPAGSFVLSHKTRLYNEGDTVTLSAFKLKTTPVTVAEFKKCVTAGACTAEHYTDTAADISADMSISCNYGNLSRTNHPMNCMDWYAATEYCEWIGGRLPTEEEWEYASTHNGTKHLNTTYPWGDAEPSSARANYYKTFSSTTEVGYFSPAGDSPLGLVDMSGNVWEWTNSLYYSDRYNRILKGGSWTDRVDFLDVTNRADAIPSLILKDIGVRCAR